MYFDINREIQDIILPSVDRLLNSLIREWGGCRFDTAARFASSLGAAEVLVLDLPASDVVVVVPVRHRSSVGYHGFAGPLRLLSGGRTDPVEIGLFDVLAMLLREPDICEHSSLASRLNLFRRAAASVAAVAEVATARGKVRPFADGIPDFIGAESALRFGHAVHPTPLSRDEFSSEDSRRFGHEYGGSFQLRWWAVHPDVFVSGSVAPHDVGRMVQGLAGGDTGLLAKAECAEGMRLFPMHPWQASRLMLMPAVQALFEAGLVRDLGLGGPPWRATTSLRTIHCADCDWMMKFSLDLKLTNSRRVIERRECDRGMSVHSLIKGALGERLAQECPTLTVLGEPAWMALRDGLDCAVLASTIVSFRENPFRHGDAPKAAVLGALCERHPGQAQSHLSDLVHFVAKREGLQPQAAAERWFERFLDVAVEPFFLAFSEFGLLFGAHQQNLVVGLDDGWPDRLYFRDCQGTGYVSEFLPLLRKHLPSAGGKGDHVFDAPAAAQLLGYYLVINGVFAAISALADAGLSSEDDLLAYFRRLLERLAARPSGNLACLDYLLRSPTLGTKGNFLFSLKNTNENTEVTDPLAGYVQMPNPLFTRKPA
jgi:N2-citryl-N6-acetyl-N6-hydroxylysine synthase